MICWTFPQSPHKRGKKPSKEKREWKKKGGQGEWWREDKKEIEEEKWKEATPSNKRSWPFLGGQ